MVSVRTSERTCPEPDKVSPKQIKSERFLTMESKANQKVRRGEIYLYNFGINEGSIQNGVRPVLIIQCDEANDKSTTTIVAAISSTIKKRYLPSHIILGDNFGLNEPSMVMLEQIQTVNQSNLIKRIGVVGSDYMLRKINIGLKNAVGLWMLPPTARKNDIRCLCVQCLEHYKSCPEFVVRRLDPFEKAKHKCDKCDNSGYDYIIYERRVQGRDD